MGSKTLHWLLPGAFFTDVALAEMECLGNTKKDGNEYSNVGICLDRLSLTSFVEGGHAKRRVCINFPSAYLRMHRIEVMQKVIGLGVVLTCKGIGLACLVLWSMKMLYTHKYDASQSVWTGQPPPFPVFWRHVSKQRKKTGWHNLHKVSNAQQKSSSLYTLGNLKI